MATFTVTIAELIELTHGQLEYKDVAYKGATYMHHPVLEGGDIGIAYYPIFDEDYRQILNGKIIDRFLNREIGSESIEMFQLHVRRKMNEVMPYFNKLYATELIDYDPMSTMDITTVGESKTEEEQETVSNTNSTSDTLSESRAVTSQTPQTMLQGSEDYASNAADSNSLTGSTTDAENNTTSSSDGKTVNNNRVTGYQAIPATLIMRYRESLLNIDLAVLTELEECFMQVFDNGDSYFGNSGSLFF